MISFIISTYNRPEYLTILLNSLLLQLNPAWEAIVMDEGDNEKYIPKDPRFRRYAFPRVHCTPDDKGSLGFLAKDAGLQYAKYPFITFCNEDIYYVPKFTTYLLNEQEKTGADLVYCDFVHMYIRYTVLVSEPKLCGISCCNYIIRKSKITHKFAEWNGINHIIFGQADGHFIDALMKEGLTTAKAEGVLMVYN